jgi:hypothetical protein
LRLLNPFVTLSNKSNYFDTIYNDE